MTTPLRLAASLLCISLAACGSIHVEGETHEIASPAPTSTEPTLMHIEYLEIVTPDVDATCETLAKLHGVTFSGPVPEFGNALTADLGDGRRLGVRAPMHESETPVIRPYILVDDIDAAVEAAKAGGGEIAHPPLEIPGQGKFAIYFQGGNQYGLWQK